MSDDTVRIAERVDLLDGRDVRGRPRTPARAQPPGVNELGREVGAVLRLDGLSFDPNSSTTSAATTRP